MSSSPDLNELPLLQSSSSLIPRARSTRHTSILDPASYTTEHVGPQSPVSSLNLKSTNKKQKLQASFTTHSPFPDYPHPTAGEALDIHNLLTAQHRPNGLVERNSPKPTGNSAQSCGGVPNVIEAVIGTILSQNTSNVNSARAKQGLDDAFGRNCFDNIVNAKKEAVVDAIRTGGLANKKAGMIQGLLKTIKERHGVYSLQHLAGEPRTPGGKPTIMKDEEIMQELMSYDGVGPKTASCVLLFCLGKDSFAVDTHVFRLSRLLGWIPATADRVHAQAHLDLRIPADLKYGLHVLMIDHGRVCKGCKKPGSRESCILKIYLKDKKIKTNELGQRLARADSDTLE